MNAAAAKQDAKGHWTVWVIQPLDYSLFEKLWKILLLSYTALIATVLDEVMLIGTMLLVSTKLQRFMIAKHFIDFLQIRILKNGKSWLINHQKMPAI